MPSNRWSALNELISILGGSLSHNNWSAIHIVFFFTLLPLGICIMASGFVFLGIPACTHMYASPSCLCFACTFPFGSSYSVCLFCHILVSLILIIFFIILQIPACFCIRTGMDSEGREDGEYLVGIERVANIIRIYQCMLNKEVKVRRNFQAYEEKLR